MSSKITTQLSGVLKEKCVLCHIFYLFACFKPHKCERVVANKKPQSLQMKTEK